MTIYKIKSRKLRAAKKRVEGTDKARIMKRLEDIQKTDPDAKLIEVDPAR